MLRHKIATIVRGNDRKYNTVGIAPTVLYFFRRKPFEENANAWHDRCRTVLCGADGRRQKRISRERSVGCVRSKNILRRISCRRNGQVLRGSEKGNSGDTFFSESSQRSWSFIHRSSLFPSHQETGTLRSFWSKAIPKHRHGSCDDRSDCVVGGDWIPHRGRRKPERVLRPSVSGESGEGWSDRTRH